MLRVPLSLLVAPVSFFTFVIVLYKILHVLETLLRTNSNSSIAIVTISSFPSFHQLFLMLGYRLSPRCTQFMLVTICSIVPFMVSKSFFHSALKQHFLQKLLSQLPCTKNDKRNAKFLYPSFLCPSFYYSKLKSLQTSSCINISIETNKRQKHIPISGHLWQCSRLVRTLQLLL